MDVNVVDDDILMKWMLGGRPLLWILMLSSVVLVRVRGMELWKQEQEKESAFAEEE